MNGSGARTLVSVSGLCCPSDDFRPPFFAGGMAGDSMSNVMLFVEMSAAFASSPSSWSERTTARCLPFAPPLFLEAGASTGLSTPLEDVGGVKPLLAGGSSEDALGPFDEDVEAGIGGGSISPPGSPSESSMISLLFGGFSFSLAFARPFFSFGAALFPPFLALDFPLPVDVPQSSSSSSPPPPPKSSSSVVRAFFLLLDGFGNASPDRASSSSPAGSLRF